MIDMINRIKRSLLYKITQRILEDVQVEIKDQQPEVSEIAPPGYAAEERAERLLAKFELEEKLRFISGEEQFSIPAIARLGIPQVWMSDATSGVRGHGPATAYPSAVALAATWNRTLIHKTAQCIAGECRVKGVSVLLAPGINIARVPTCGRNFEYMGEDPFLTGEIATAYIRGVQTKGVAATVKHFVANNSDYDRHRESSEIDTTTLRELYLPAFRKTVKVAGTKAVMTAYNPVNGTWMSENRRLVKEILKSEWDFKGVVVSDWISTYSTATAVLSGLDIEMPAARCFTFKKLKRELERGRIHISDIDAKVRALLLLGFEIGAYDRPVIERKEDAKVSTRAHTPSGSLEPLLRKHSAVARTAAEEAVVLLKNDSLLPLDRTRIKSIVVIGRTAAATDTGGGGSSYVPSENSVSMLAGIRSAAANSPECTVEYIPSKRPPFSDAERQKIETADAVICATGFDHILESEFYDRSWRLPGHEAALISAAQDLNPRTVVVLTAGGDVCLDPWADSAKAIIHSFYLGENAGSVIADLIFGHVNPSGRLPFTMARQWDDIAATRNYHSAPEKISFRRFFGPQGIRGLRSIKPLHYQEGLAVGYRNFDMHNIKPRFPFGHGLSYTVFSYEALLLTEPRLTCQQLPDQPDGATLAVEVLLTNIGNLAGSEVIQVYVSYPVPPTGYPDRPRPPKALRGFEKVHLQPGESARVKIPIENRAFFLFNAEQENWHVIPGSYTVMCGASSRDIRLTSTVIVR